MTQFPTIAHLLEEDDGKHPVIILGPSEETIKREARWLRENCSEWWEQSHGRSAYRGSNGSVGMAGQVIDVRADRMSHGMDSSTTRIFNEKIQKSGLTALRSNSLFITGDDALAVEFGKAFIVVPIGPFDFTWSPQIRDANYWRWELEDGDVGERQPSSTPSELLDPALANALFYGNDDSLYDALESGHEILLRPHSGQAKLYPINFFRKVAQHL